MVDVTCKFWCGPPWGTTNPLAPLPVLPPRQKGNQSASLLIMHPFAYSSRPWTKVLQSYGARTEIRTPMHTWPTRHPQLACAARHCHCFRPLLTISCWHDSRSLEWTAASLAWLTPRSGPKHVCLWLLDISTDPPFTQFAQNGCQSTGLELEIPAVYLKFREWPRNVLDLPPILWTSPDWTHTNTGR